MYICMYLCLWSENCVVLSNCDVRVHVGVRCEYRIHEKTEGVLWGKPVVTTKANSWDSCLDRCEQRENCVGFEYAAENSLCAFFENGQDLSFWPNPKMTFYEVVRCKHTQGIPYRFIYTCISWHLHFCFCLSPHFLVFTCLFSLCVVIVDDWGLLEVRDKIILLLLHQDIYLTILKIFARVLKFPCCTNCIFKKNTLHWVFWKFVLMSVKHRLWCMWL